MASTRCYHPVQGYVALGGGISFDAHKSTGIPTSVPCGRCLGCRLENSRQWAVRMMHEAQTHDTNCFLTLTYDDDHVPSDYGLDKHHVRAFIRELRKAIAPQRVRYFQCGEYGSEGDRPHYHCCLFGYSFPDRKKWTTRRGNIVHRSDELESLWRHGYSEIGGLTFKSAAYVARYTTKKISLSEHSSEEAITAYQLRYERVNAFTGEITEVEPEHATMSLKPGIGEPWFRKFWSDVYPADLVVMNGKTMRPPRYYDRLLERQDPDLWQRVRRARASSRDLENTTPDRLRSSEICKEAEVSLYQQRM